uniref:CD3 gamma/delta subunit Ig-like domain-containing protein n=1 Tax=Cyprinodon variegatus TaxID=28743 RepID=A0A3Q2FYA1_CYPVA
MGVQAAFIVLLMFVAAVEAQKGGVTVWRGNVTMTCPEKGKWSDGKQIIKNDSNTLEVEFKGVAQYVCVYKEGDTEKIYSFYVRGKACKNCYEVDGYLFLLVILVDVIVTAVVMRMVYVCFKKKQPDVIYDAPPRVRRSRPRQEQSSAYESLNPSTQATETYSAVVHKTG